MMRLKDIIALLEALAPCRYAEPWDNVGLLVGDVSQQVGRILLTVDYTEAVAQEALDLACELVLSYHPPWLTPVHRLVWDSGDSGCLGDFGDSGALKGAAHAIRHGVSLYSPHTALDAVEGGTHDVLADALGVQDRKPLRTLRVQEPLSSVDPSGPVGPVGLAHIGSGRVGILPKPLACSQVVARLKRALGLAHVLCAGLPEAPVQRVAVVAGAGGGLLKEALKEQAQLFVTGELSHHKALQAQQGGMGVVATLHSHSERAVLPVLRRRLQAHASDVEILISQKDAEVFRMV